MPPIADVARQLVTDGLPVLFIDTCVLLDIIRAPLRKTTGCIQEAVLLAEMHAQSACRIVASSSIQNEWNTHEQAVVNELDNHLSSCDKNAAAFHEACGHVNVPVSFSKASYQNAGLAKKLRDLSSELLKYAMHISASDETDLRAINRNRAYVPPARKGAGPDDCIIIEEYLELCRQLRASGFGLKKVFCTSNKNDYQDGRKLHSALESDFDSVGLIYTNALHWAMSELVKP